ncbi:peptide/nickel transport system ATP-binding protein [Asanoa hainanensis]|uniref:Peptide/nickel transport system ATP-binding protein n=1 Tax=Asanoa hainanensis TaxID=560556 RepID=A0A239PAS8_9ACTN|nr:ABC transporter ATP-binding protein [Asanoa hainanensis]SNT64022.1 peptide/nickel transport system ATP-binding protein [Asanoa hainanensis]
MSLLTVSDLTVSSADGRTLVDGLSFSVGRGHRLGLIGESGSGKSLTTLAVAGLLPPGLRASGTVLLDGTSVLGAPERSLNRLRGRVAAVVFQEPSTALDPLMRLGHQVAEPLRRHQGLRGAALKAAVLASLEEVALPARVARAYPHEVSGGQRQRAAIAMALACRPALLIADEPTTALDVTVQAEVLALLDRLATAHEMALLFVSHDLAVVGKVTDEVVVLSAGRAVRTGPLRSVLADPGDAYTAALVASARRLDEALGGAL